MACTYCNLDFGHHPRCPLYEESKSNLKCTVCGDNIAYGDDYVKNVDGDYAHNDCLTSRYSLITFLGGESGELECGVWQDEIF